jgi:hypothetical protein
LGRLRISVSIAIMVILGLSLVLGEDSSLIQMDTTLAKMETLQYVDPSSAFVSITADSSWWYRKISNPAFGVGEYLEFNITYGFLPAGTAIMQIPGTVEYNGRHCYQIVTIATSNDFLSKFYTVRDTVESYIDAEGIFPYYFRKHLREGGYRIDRSTFFDQRVHVAITGTDSISTYAFVQDVLSSLYFIRTQKLIPGKDILIDNHTDKKNYPLRVIVHGREKVEVPAGEFNCVVVEPVMRYEGIFKAKGSIKIWLTDDRFKIPVKMQSEVVVVGSISVKLKKYTYGQISE